MTPEFRFADEAEAGAVTDISVTAGDIATLSGWATASEPGRWAYLCALPDSASAIFAIANRFSQEAFDRKLGFGWIGFEIDLAPQWEVLRGTTVSFHCVKSGETVFEYDVPDLALPPDPRPDKPLSLREALMRPRGGPNGVDPRRLSLYVDAFVATFGPREYIRRAYLYVLERAMEADELRAQETLIQSGRPPIELLSTLLSCREYGACPRAPLVLPGEAPFPFYPG